LPRTRIFTSSASAKFGNIAAQADPFVKQRLLDLADRYDDKRKMTITPLPSAPAAAASASGDRENNPG
jgi:hypothetical protein